MKRSLSFFAATLIAACNTGQDNAGPSSPPPDPQTVTRQVDIDHAASIIEWQRDKRVKNTNNTIKLGKGTLSFNLDDASFTTNGTIKVKDGYWLVKDDKLHEGLIHLDMASISSVQLNEDHEPEVRNPDYLDVQKYPFATISIRGLVPKNDSMLVKATITIKDTTGSIEFPAKVEMSSGTNSNIPQSLSGKFVLDGIAWKLNRPKNGQEVVTDKLEFLCNFRTK